MKYQATIAKLAVPALMGTLLAACAVAPSNSGSAGTAVLIPAETVTALNQGGNTREEIGALLGAPSYTGLDGRFLAYERNAAFRSMGSGGTFGARTNSPSGGAVRQDVIYYQVVGVWLDHQGHVMQAKEFVAPCAACAEGDSLLSESELEQWMRGNRPRG